MNNAPKSARQLETRLLACIARAAATADKHSTNLYSARTFTAALCGALEADGNLALAKALAAGAGMGHLYPAEEA